MEISYVDNVWHVFSAIMILLAGAVFFLLRPIRSVSSRISILIYLWHTLFCLYYARFALYNTADARGYFIRSLNPDISFSLGTQAVDFITALLTQGLYLSYIGAFFVFNIFGAIGLLAYAGALREILSNRSRDIKRLAILLVFLPGVSFWSVAIGKDALAFFGTGLLCWGALKIRQRWMAIVLAIAAYLLVRPQVVPIVLVAAMAATLFSGRLSKTNKMLIATVMLIPTVFALQLAMSMVGLGGAKDVGDFIDYRQSVNLEGGSSIDIANMNIIMRLFLYAFGPLFAGMGGLLGLVASIENFILLGFVLLSFWYVYKEPSCLPPITKWFYLLFALSSWLVFANVTANLGIALRQKWMFMPMLLLFLISHFPERQRVS